MKMRYRVMLLVVIVASLMGRTPAYAQQPVPPLAANVDVAQLFPFSTPLGSTFTFLWVGGWAVGNGVTPQKTVFIDGRPAGMGWPVVRQDVCDYFHAIGGMCDEDKFALCVTNADSAGSNACAGVSLMLDVTRMAPGPHVANICATASVNLTDPPMRVCSPPKTFIIQ